MAQRSLPQAGTGVGDSGPYSSDEWAEYFQVVYTGDQEATQGPIRRFLNELEVTEAALSVTIATGAGFVYGHWLIVDVAVGINIALAAAGQERYDRVVMVQNNTAAAYNTNLALPAAYAAGVPRNSARIAILQGAEAGAAVLPPLLTGPNYYMVELARYLVDDAAVGAVTDYRDYCLGTTADNRREVLVMPFTSFNSSQLEAPLSGYNIYGLMMTNDDYCQVSGSWIIPPAWDESPITITAIVYPWAGGNVYSSNAVRIGPCGGNHFATGVTSGTQAIAMTSGGINNCIQAISVTDVEADAGDILGLLYIREADDVLDTVEATVVFRGWIVAYTVR